MEINLVELASVLAENITESETINRNEESSYRDDEDGVYKYYDKYQKIFNAHYDNMWNYLTKYGFKHKNI